MADEHVRKMLGNALSHSTEELRNDIVSAERTQHSII